MSEDGLLMHITALIINKINNENVILIKDASPGVVFWIQFLVIVVVEAVWLDFESNLNRSNSFDPKMLMMTSADYDVIDSDHSILVSKAWA